jgi:hypothetical protein
MMALLMISTGVIDYDDLPGPHRAMVKRGIEKLMHEQLGRKLWLDRHGKGMAYRDGYWRHVGNWALKERGERKGVKELKRAPMRDMCAYIRELITQEGKSDAA